MLGNKLKAISIDVGKANGTAKWTFDLQGNYKLEYIEALTKSELYKILEEEHFDIIIYEGYRLYAKMASTMIGNEFETPQIIGVVKYLAEKKNISIVEQLATAKKFWTDDRLRDMGLYVTIDHKRDAIRHFLYWYYMTAKYGDKRDLLPK